MTQITSLLEVDHYTPKQIDELCQVLTDKLRLQGWDHLPVDEQVQLRLLHHAARWTEGGLVIYIVATVFGINGFPTHDRYRR